MKRFVLIILFILLITWIYPAALSSKEQYNILILNSYHPEYEWSKELNDGIEKVFLPQANKIFFHYEYMDAKRHPRSDYIEGPLYQSLSYKFRKKTYDVIIVCDNDAFSFALRHKKELFPTTPVVFCGVNNFSDEQIAGHKDITGVVEDISVKETLNIIPMMQKSLSRIIVLGSQADSTSKNTNLVLKSVIGNSEWRKTFEFIDLPLDEILLKLRKLDSTSAVIFKGAILDRSGHVIDLVGALKMMRKECPVPIYSFWKFYLGNGIVGGKLVSAYGQGEAAAGIALRIISGEPAHSIPVNKNSPNLWMFDYNELKRFNMDLSILPEGSIVINKPFSFYDHNKKLVWATIAIFTFQIIIIAFLVLNILSKRKTEEALKNAFQKRKELEFIVNYSPAIVWLWKAETGWPVEYVSENINTYGYAPDDFTSSRISFASIVHPDDLSRVSDEVQKYTSEGKSDFLQEYRIVTKSGDVRWIDDRTYVRRDANGTVTHYQGIIIDINDHKQAEDALKLKTLELDRYFASSLDLLCIADTDGYFRRLNPEWENSLGYSIKELEGKRLLDFVHPEDLEATLNAMATLSGQNEILNFENRYRAKDGSYRWIEWRSIPQGNTIYAVARDITKRKQAEKALRESEELYRVAVQGANDGIAIIKNSVHVFVNEQFLSMFGYESYDEIAELPSYFTVHPDDREWVRGIATARQRGEDLPKKYEFKGIKKDGTTIYIEVSVNIITYKGDRALLVFLRDITKRKEAEESLQKSHEILERSFKFNEALLTAIPNPVFYKDKEGRYLGCNPSFTEIMGITADDIKGKTVYEVSPSELAKVYHEKDLELMKNPGRQIYEFQVKDKNGIERPVIYYKDVFYDEKGEVAGIIGAFMDFTERKQIEEKLRESEDLYRSIFQNSPVGIITTSLNGHILSANPKFCNITGYTETELKEYDVKDITPVEDFEKEKDLVRSMKSSAGESVSFEKRYRTKMDQFIWANVSISFIYDKQGSPLFVMGVVEDITEQKKAEKEKEALQAQLLQAQKMESVGRLAGGVAHDFNNMLSAILGHAELAMMDILPSESVYANLKGIQDSAIRSADLTRQLLAFARKQTIAPRVLDLNETIDGMLKILRRLIGEDIDLVWKPGEGLWQINVDPSQIDQLLANLCINSRDAISEVGKVTIETGNTAFDEAYCSVHKGFKQGEYVMLAVSDDGYGMSKDVLNHIFEPFFTTKETGKGTGLGLATVYGIVKQNEGFINVYSEPGKGSTFKLYFPRAAGEAIIPILGTHTESLKGQGEILLLVEDETIMLNVINVMLETLGYTVMTANRPSEALRKAQEYKADIQLLITDVVMPEMNGRELAKLIRDIKPGLKCLFTSGYTANVIAHRGILDEGINFIQKPFSMQTLAAKVREILDQK